MAIRTPFVQLARHTVIFKVIDLLKSVLMVRQYY